MIALHRIAVVLTMAIGTIAAAGGNTLIEREAARDAATVDKVITLQPVGNELKYATTEIRAKAGTTLKIVFENTSTIMPHSVVVLKRHEDIELVGQGALTAVEHDYVPPQHRDKLVAFTSMAAPGKTVEVTFTVPPPGAYLYLCTFPGHYVLMRGTLISEK